MDAIAEVKVLTSNYQAEFGRNSGGTITVITKSGSKDLHVTAYDTYRNEELNANGFWNNRQSVARTPYRYRITGYTVGGPVFIPKKFNRNRDKLFFFWSQEYTGQRKNYGTNYLTVPTALERSGDFSKSLDSSGKLITIYDPITQTPMAGNVIPKNRFSTLGSAILNFFPLPNYTDPVASQVNQHNYVSQYTGNYPKREDMIRVDYNITPSLQVYWRYIQDKDEQQTPYGIWVNGNINYALDPITFGQPGHGHVIHITKTFSPTVVNEFIFGRSHNNLYFYPSDASTVDRAKVGNPGLWYGGYTKGTGVSYLQTANYMPNITFGGQPANVVNNSFGNIPYENYNDIYNFTDNLSKVMGSHNLKVGVYFEHTAK
jgi:hypothetical protein